MNKKIIIAGIVIILLIVSVVLLSKKGETPKQNKQSADTIVNEVEKAIGNTGNIKLPSDIKKITDELRQQYQNQICQKEDKVYCEYYTQLDKKTGEKRIKNLERTSLCALVRGLGQINSDLYEYETIGYEEKPCYQGMYAK